MREDIFRFLFTLLEMFVRHLFAQHPLALRALYFYAQHKLCRTVIGFAESGNFNLQKKIN